MEQVERVDALIIGSGAGGKLLAWHLGKSGRRTAVVERRYIGGSCPNINCLPSKNEVKSAEVAHLIHGGAEYGTTVTGASTDMAKVVARKRAMVDELVQGHLEDYRASGAELVLGEARFVAPKTVEVMLNGGGTRWFLGDRVFLNLGTRAFVPPVPGLAAVAMTNIELLDLDRLPRRLIVLGGGYVGMELAQAYRRFGSRVTVLVKGPQVLSQEDPEVADALQRLFADEEIEILLNSELLRVEGERGALRIITRTKRAESTLEATDILVATGRTPNTTAVGLDLAGVNLDSHGYIAVNERLETSAPDVWAMGECAGSPQFTHASVDDFRVIRDNLAGQERTTRGRLVPFCVFTDPPLARVGVNEIEARRRGIEVRVGTLPASAILRTHATGETRGFMKALVDTRSDQILGFTMFAAAAGEVMAIVQVAMLGRIPFTAFSEAIFTHPTMAEGLGALFSTLRR